MQQLRWLWLFILWTGICAAPAFPQDPQAPFVDRIDVRLVEVEVVVTDKEGNRVTGLDRDDFRLIVDGREVPLEFFDEVVRTSGSEQIEGMEVSTTTELEPIADPEKGRSFLLFFDEQFTDTRGRNALLKRLEDELELFGPGDRMAAVRYAGGGLEVLSDWTDSPETLREVFAEERKFIPEILQRRAQLAATGEPRSGEFVVAEQIQRSVTAMVVAMRAFSQAPGRKMLLPVTSGWPYQNESAADGPVGGGSLQSGGPEFGEPGLGVTDEIAEAEGPIDSAISRTSQVAELGAVRQYRSFEMLQPMFDTANRLGFTVYPYLVGQPCDGAGAASVLCIEDFNLQRQSLIALAQETGGVLAGLGATTRTPFANVVDDTSRYYVLAFRYEDAVPGQRADIEVEIERPGLEIRHRRSVLELTRRARATLETEEALLLGKGAGNLVVKMGEPKVKRRVVRLPLEVQVPLDWVTLIPKGNKRQLDVEIRVAALDENGARSEVPVIPLEAEIPPPPPGVHITWEGEVELRKTSQRLVVSLHDTLSGDALSAALDFEL